MLRYFPEGLKPSILAKLEHQNLELESFDQMLKKPVNAKAKTAPRPCSSIREIDQHWSQGKQLANTTTAKAKLQGQSIKDPQTEKSKARGPELLLIF